MRHVKYVSILLGLVLVGMFSTKAQAQSSAIKYGQAVTGELTDANAAINYTFQADANDVVVIRMKQDGTDSSVAPHLVLQDAKLTTVADTKDQIAIFSVNLAVQLTDAGQYTITATSADGKGKGKFQVSLAKATVLKPGAPVSDKANSETYVYYAYTSGSPFEIAYEKKGGDFAPTVAVNRVDNHELKSIGELNGEQVAKGSIGIQPKQNELYVISIGEGTLDINFESVSADYTLTLTTAQ